MRNCWCNQFSEFGCFKRINCKIFSKCISHRGPDADGFYMDQNIAFFAHKRLSIIDIDSNSNQPMFSEDKNIVLVYNGEIYNHEEIERDFIKNIYSKQKTQTQKLSLMHTKWGMKCLDYFVGCLRLQFMTRKKIKFFWLEIGLAKNLYTIYQKIIHYFFVQRIKLFLILV